MKIAFYCACASASLLLCINLASVTAQTQQPASSQQPAQTQQSTQSPKPDETPVTDGASGPCSIEFNVSGTDGKPVFAALINVHMAWGFVGAHKLDMGVYTNAQGKAKFIGIPVKVRNPPIEFHAKKDDLVGVATMDPQQECQAKHDIALDKEKPAAQPTPSPSKP
jgi:hypothetical protein